jgi:hypothetical protein
MKLNTQPAKEFEHADILSNAQRSRLGIRCFIGYQDIFEKAGFPCGCGTASAPRVFQKLWRIASRAEVPQPTAFNAS